MRERTYRIFLGGQVASLLGDGLALLAIPLLVLQLTRSPLLAGLASAARAVGYVLAGLPAGPLVDRLDARSVLIWTDIIRALLFLALGLSAIWHVPAERGECGGSGRVARLGNPLCRRRPRSPSVLANPVYRLRMLTLAEGWSFVVLLVFGSLLSRVSDIDLVMPLGILHGALFTALVISILTVRGRLGWGAGTTSVALVAGVLPLTPFLFHRLKRDELLRAQQAA